MSRTLFKSLLLLVCFASSAIFSWSQDIIVKNDRSEIKSKVTEITETGIKYKKWDNLDGPIYNIGKSDVFMIIYGNGKRETIAPPSNPSNTPTTTTLMKPETNSNLANQIKQTSASNLDTSIDYKNLKIKYKPTRINVGFQSPLSIGFDREFRVLKNCLNIGLAYHYTFPKDDYILESSFGFIYASLYAPVNRLTGNYRDQDKGLFVFGNAGYGASYTKFMDAFGKTETATSGGFTWRLGADYFITKGFGITLSTYECKTFFGGISISL